MDIRYIPVTKDDIEDVLSTLAKWSRSGDIFLEMLKKDNGKNISITISIATQDKVARNMAAMCKSNRILVAQEPEGPSRPGFEENDDCFLYQVPEEVYAILKHADIRDGAVHWEDESSTTKPLHDVA
jgi:hypothetical protein